jgi:methylamine dehydrogenase heavy chain
MNNFLSTLTAAVLAVFAVPGQAEVEPEPVGVVETLPGEYPDHWLMVHDAAFPYLLEGRVHVLDPLAEGLSGQVKGMITASFFAAYQRSAVRNEHYVMESFFSRGGRGGERTDFVTIWDPASLTVTAEIEVPAKRISGMPKVTMTGLLGGDRFLGVYNFTPAQSVSIIDLEKRTFVGEVMTPGCGFVLPNGERSFTSLCSNGTMLTSHLDTNGKPAGTSRTEKWFDANDDPIFETAVVVDDIAYFPTFTGEILPVDVSEREVEAGERWPLAQNDEEASWRPGGAKLIVADSSGTGYVLMHPDGGEGTHKNGGGEVWVYDLARGERLARLALTNWGLSLATSGSGEGRLLFVTNVEMGIDVYSLPGGEHLKTLTSGGIAPLMLYGAH